MNEYIALAIAVIIVMGIGIPLVTLFDKWKKKMDEDGDDDVLE